MDAHKRLLAILHIVYGTIHILIFAFISLLANTLLPFILAEIGDNSEETMLLVNGIMLLIRSVMFVLFVIVPLPSIIGGIAQLNNKQWGLTTMMVSGCLSLFNIPIGTALGIYTIWVYLENKKTKPE
ncbi:MAG: hypothetical protein RIH33_03680 [Marinoscillum sp.]